MRNSLAIIFLSLLIESCARVDANAPIIYNHNKSHQNKTTPNKSHQNETSRSSTPIIDADGNFSYHSSNEDFKEDFKTNSFQKEEIIEPHVSKNQVIKSKEVIKSNQVIQPKEDRHDDLDFEDGIADSQNEASIADSQNEASIADSPNEESITDSQDFDSSALKAEEKTIFHEVQSGETLEDIALFYEQPVEEIAKLNHLQSPYIVEALQSLRIRVPKDYIKKEVPSANNANIDSGSTSIFIKPVDGEIISKFGKSSGAGSDQGINIASKAGNKVKAAASGTVIYSDYDATFGNLVIIKLDNKNMVTAYAHLQDLVVKKGDKISQSNIVGYVGSTGKVDQSQLYFAIREGKKPVDPLKYLRY